MIRPPRRHNAIVHTSKKRSSRGNPPFYEVFGQRYYVMDSSNGFKERGVASWYGKKFHGRLTSSGVIYDMHAMTAAHKTLPSADGSPRTQPEKRSQHHRDGQRPWPVRR